MLRYAALCWLLAQALAFGQTNVLSVGRMPAVKAKIGSTVEVKVPLVLRPGFHVNSNPAADKYLIPLQLTWEPGLLAATSVVYPKPATEKYPFYPVPLQIYSGTFEVTTTFKVAPTAAPGPAAVNGTLRYQACNDRECLQPKTMKVAIQVDLVR